VSRSKYLFIAGLILLIAQYNTGMVINVYVTPPYTAGGYFGIHYIIGLVLVLVGVIAVIMTALSRRIVTTLLAVVGLISILIAGESGREFAFITQQNGVYALLMAWFWLVAFTTYFLGQQLTQLSTIRRSYRKWGVG